MPLNKSNLNNEILNIFNSTLSSTPAAAAAWSSAISNYFSGLTSPPSSTMTATVSASGTVLTTGLTASFNPLTGIDRKIAFAPVDVFIASLALDSNSVSIGNVLTPPTDLFGNYAFQGIDFENDSKSSIAKTISENIHNKITSLLWTNPSGVTATWA